MRILLLIALLGPAGIACAGDILPVLKTVNSAGTVLELRDVRVVKVEADGVRVMHSLGTAKVPYERLPEELLMKYGIDPSKADQYRAEASSKVAAPVAATGLVTTAATPLLSSNSGNSVTKEHIKQMWLRECQSTFICPADPQYAAKKRALDQRVAAIRSGAWDGTAEEYAKRASARHSASAAK